MTLQNKDSIFGTMITVAEKLEGCKLEQTALYEDSVMDRFEKQKKCRKSRKMKMSFRLSGKSEN